MAVTAVYLARSAGFARGSSSLGRTYTAEQMHQMGAVNAVAEHAELEAVGTVGGRIEIASGRGGCWFAFNLLDDGLVGGNCLPVRPPPGLHDRRR